MRDPKRKYLRYKGNQWQFYKRLPKDVISLTGKRFYVANLGTADLIQAQKLRTRKLVEFDDLCDRLREGVGDIDAEIAQQLQQMADTSETDETNDRDTLLLHLQEQAEKRPDGVQWYKNVTGRAVTISLNIDRFIKEAQAAGTTQKARRAAIKRFEIWLKTKNLEPLVETVTKKVAGDFASYLTSQGLVQKTVNGLIQYLSSYWKWMVRRGVTHTNPWMGQQLSAEGASNPKEIWEPDEIARLLNSAPSKLLLHATAIAVLSGLRAGELARLLVADCRDGVFNIREGKTKSAIRKVPIHSQLSAVIDARKTGKADNELMFPELGGKAKGLVKRFSHYRARLFGKGDSRQAPKTLHSLRHTFVTRRLQAGSPEPIVGALVGHKPRGVTLSVYHHGFTNDQLREVVEAVRLPAGLDNLIEESGGLAREELGDACTAIAEPTIQ